MNDNATIRALIARNVELELAIRQLNVFHESRWECSQSHIGLLKEEAMQLRAVIEEMRGKVSGRKGPRKQRYLEECA